MCHLYFSCTLVIMVWFGPLNHLGCPTRFLVITIYFFLHGLFVYVVHTWCLNKQRNLCGKNIENCINRSRNSTTSSNFKSRLRFINSQLLFKDLADTFLLRFRPKIDIISQKKKKTCKCCWSNVGGGVSVQEHKSF